MAIMRCVSAVFVVLLALLPSLASAQIRSLYSDPKANRIGDALTVLIQENATASNQMATATGKSNTTSISSTIPGGVQYSRLYPVAHALQPVWQRLSRPGIDFAQRALNGARDRDRNGDQTQRRLDY